MTKDDIDDIIKEEGNFKEFKDKGYTCIVNRCYSKSAYAIMFHLCGYVVLEANHKCYGLHYDDIHIDCHGGLTYAGAIIKYPKYESLGGRMIGFDCSHSGDISSILMNDPCFTVDNGVYRDMKYVVNNIKDMVEQLIKLDPTNSNIIRNKGIK